MLLRLLDFLVCPLDKTPLELLEWETSSLKLSKDEMVRAERQGIDPILFSRQVLTGVLLNHTRKIFYPIHRGVPRMLVFPTGVARDFVKNNSERITRELPEFTLPTETAMPGEESVLRTFSSEWLHYDWDGQAYWNATPDQMYKHMVFMLDLERRPVRDKVLLEVGIGVGGIANHLARTQQCELLGIDLSYAVDAAYRHFGSNPFLHIVQASAFAPPFKERSFDFVYSQGVLHHTFSTKAAFDGVSKLPKSGGRLYVWVYSPENETRTIVRRILMSMESIVRPVCTRLPESLQTAALLPILPLYLIHQNLYVTRGTNGHVKYGWREALHAARDRFTPRYAHRHTEKEVRGWFHDAGYRQLQSASSRQHPESLPKTFVACTAVDGIRL